MSEAVSVVLSKASIRSAWVRLEVENAFDLERARGQTVLFPIRVDDSVFEEGRSGELIELKRRVIGDVTGWEDQGAYRQSFSRLVRDLAISASDMGTQDGPGLGYVIGDSAL